MPEKKKILSNLDIGKIFMGGGTPERSKEGLNRMMGFGTHMQTASVFALPNSTMLDKGVAVIQDIAVNRPEWTSNPFFKGVASVARNMQAGDALGYALSNPLKGAAAASIQAALDPNSSFLDKASAIVGGFLGGKRGASEKKALEKLYKKEVKFKDDMFEKKGDLIDLTMSRIDANSRFADEQYALNKEIIQYNASNALKTAFFKNEDTKRLAEALMGEQRVQLAANGFYSRGGAEFVTAETESQSLRTQQQTNLQLGNQLVQLAFQNREMDNAYEAQKSEQRYAMQELGIQKDMMLLEHEHELETLKEDFRTKSREQRTGRGNLLGAIGSGIIKNAAGVFKKVFKF